MNPILLNVLLILAFALVGYLLGGIPTGVIIGKVFYHKDPREFGSHNSGGTNAGRVLGKKAGYAVIGLDMLKSVITYWGSVLVVTLTGLISNPEIWRAGAILPWVGVVACAFGHCFSIYLKGFKGGKAVSCFLGAIAFTSWIGLVVTCIVFFPIFLPKKVMSVATLITGAVVTIFHIILACLLFIPGASDIIRFFSWSFGSLPCGLFFGWEAAIGCILIYALLVIRHSSNIARLRAGEEKGVSWSGKVDN